MKKIILCLVFVFSTSTSFMNANQSNETKEVFEDFGCLTDAYNAANRFEAKSEAGEYGWSIEVWSIVFNHLFDECNKGVNINAM